MKKNLCLFLLTLFMCGGSAMAGNRLARDGYVGNIELTPAGERQCRFTPC